MVKKQKPSAGRPAPKPSRFDPETMPYFAPAAFAGLFVAMVILFSKFLFSDKMLYMSDQIQAGVFFRSLLVNFFDAHGRIPQWNPYIFGGMPFVDAFHGDIFYPFSALKFIGSVYRMLGINLFLHIFVSGIFMYLCARQFKLGKLASLFAGACYMFSGYLVSLVAPGHDGKIFVTTLFPLVMLFFDRGFEAKSLLNFTLGGLVIGLIILTPHAQMAYFTLWAAALFTIYKLVTLYLERRSIVPLIRPSLLAVYAVVIGLLISAIQFYPGYHYTTTFSPREDTKKGWDWATSWSMHEEEAASLIIPEFCGVTTENAETYYWGKNFFKDNSESVGVTALFAALIGAFIAKRRGRWFFVGLALFAFFYSLGATTPLFRIFYAIIPKVSSLRAPSMIMFLFLFSTCMLGGMGIQQLLDNRRQSSGTQDKRVDYLLIAFPALLLILALLFTGAGKGMLSAWCSIFYSDAPRTAVQQGVTKLDVAYMNLPAIRSGAWLGFLFVGLAALFVWWYRTGKMGTGILLALVLVPVVDGIRFNRKFIDTYDAKGNWAPTPVTQFFASDPSSYRVMNLQKPQDDILPSQGIEVVIGYHGNQLRWYDDLVGGPARTNQFNPRFLNLVGTKYLIGPANSLPAGYLGPKPVVTAVSFGQVSIMRNDNALPRAFFVDSFRVIPERKDITPLILNGTSDLRTLAYLEEDPGLAPSTPSPTDSAWVISHAVDSVVVGVNCAHDRLMVLTDTYYESWHVTIDGNPGKIYRADEAFRGVVVPGGSKEVKFTYDSPRYRKGRMITWLTSLYVLVIIGLYVIPGLRKAPTGKPSES